MKTIILLILTFILIGCDTSEVSYKEPIKTEIKTDVKKEQLVEEKHCGRNAIIRHKFGFKKHKLINAAIYSNCKNK